jgi:hypothetical protein
MALVMHANAACPSRSRPTVRCRVAFAWYPAWAIAARHAIVPNNPQNTMKSVLIHILRRKRDYAKLPFFDFLRDESIAPRDRLAFVPAMANFIMSFGDFNRYVLRDDANGNDPHQRMLDDHSREDDHHWPWYLEDFAKLGFDAHLPASEVMRFLWSPAFARNRMLSHRLAHLVWLASPAVRLAVVEAIEETGNVLFALTAQVARDVETQIGDELRYLGDFHFALESGHAMNNDHAELAAIELNDADRADALRRVDAVYALFEGWVDELLAYARERIAEGDAPAAVVTTRVAGANPAIAAAAAAVKAIEDAKTACQDAR